MVLTTNNDIPPNKINTRSLQWAKKFYSVKEEVEYFIIMEMKWMLGWFTDICNVPYSIAKIIQHVW